jgi:gliding motility-associated-like protein
VKNNSLENLFKDKIGNLEVDVNPDLWKNISNSLPKQGPIAGKSNWKGGATIAAAVILISGFVAFNLNKEPIESITETEKVSKLEAVEKTQTNTETKVVSEMPKSVLNTEIKSTQNNKDIEKNSSPINDDVKLNASLAPQSINEVEGNTINPIAKDELVGQAELVQKTVLKKRKNNSDGFNRTEVPVSNAKAELKANITYNISKENNLAVNFSTDLEHLNYDWNFGDGIHSSDENPLHNYEKEGKYTVSCTVTDEKGNKIAANKESLEIFESTIFFTPSAFTPNGDGINDFYQVTVSSKISEFKMDIYDLRRNKVFSTNNQFDKWNGPETTPTDIQGSRFVAVITVKSISGRTETKTQSITIN